MSEPDEIDLVHADDTLLVLCKPSGLPAVPGRTSALQDCLARRVQRRFADALVVHRLDMATSGLMLMARGAAAQRALGIAFARREVEKRYVAIVAGHPAAPAGDGWGEIDLPLAADWPARPRQIVDFERGKPALTRYRILAHDADAGTTQLELQPMTGRTHQLRVHLMAIGHAIVGDTLYATPAVQAMARRLALHASRLEFAHPASGARLAFTSAAPFLPKRAAVAAGGAPAALH
ncbi:MAG TPA: RluA family pseudouridine synthase [Burkholderiaceae bacterium]|nr:RluA family pseudouridine synthase [Burkholderiaceae bacterium]